MLIAPPTDSVWDTMRGGRNASFLALALVLVAAAFVVSVPGQARAASLTPHAPIVISSNADFTAANGVIGGSGIWSDPYVIEGWVIDASTSTGISIANTNASFAIQNVSVHSGGDTYDGIYLFNISNAVVADVNASFDYAGLTLFGADNVSVYRGQFSFDDAFGVLALEVDGVRILGTTVYYLQNSGISVLYASYVEVSGNVVTADPTSIYSQTGISLSEVTHGYVSHNVVSGCTNSDIGIGTSVDVLTSQNVLTDSYWSMQFHNNQNSYVMDNTFVSNVYGIIAYQDTSTNLTENHFEDNTVALYMETMDKTLVAGNTFVLNGRGIWQVDSTSSAILGNVMTGDGLTILGSTRAAFDSHTITPDNTVNGLPIVYSKGGTSVAFHGTGAGEVIVVDATGVDLSNLSISDTDSPIEVAYSSSVRVSSNTLQNDWNSIVLVDVNGADVVGNTISGVTYGPIVEGSRVTEARGNVIAAARYGIFVGTSDGTSLFGNQIGSARLAGIAIDSSTNAFLSWNNLTANGNGITVSSSSLVQIHQNTIAASSGTGVALVASPGVNVTHNDFEGNAAQASADAATSATWNGGYPSGGNHWSDYGGVDQCSGPAQNLCPGPDGIGDTPYVIDASNADAYPLMAPDRAVPPVASFTVTPGVGGAGTTFAVDASASYDPANAGRGLVYRWDWNADGIYDTAWSSSPIAFHAYTVDGQYTIRLEVMGITGLTATAAHGVVFDTTRPVTTAYLSGVPGMSPWYQSAVTVTLVASDALSGVASTQYRIDGSVWQPYTGPFTIGADGSHVVEFRSTDLAGNVESVKSVAVEIDTVAPTTTVTLTAPQVKPHWYRSPVTVTITASDATSGVLSVVYSLDGGPWQTYTGPFTVSDSGMHTIEIQATDNAGNAGPIQTVTFTIKR